MLAIGMLLVGLSIAPPQETEAVPPWKQPGSPLPALLVGSPHLERLVARHEENWTKYRRLAMTPIDETPGFLDRFRAALEARMEHLPELPKDESGEVIMPIPAAPAAVPDGPMTPALNRKLAEAVVDQLLFMQDRPFDFQRQRWLAQRRFTLQFPDAEFNAADSLESMARTALEEEIDAERLKEAEQWALIERFYDERRQVLDGAYCVTGAAIDTGMGLRAGVYESRDLLDSDRLFFRFGDDAKYWAGGLLACGLRVTWPPTPPSEIIERDGKVLRADVRLVVETKNGDRAPLSIHAYFDPAAGEDGRWEIDSCCFVSSPFAAAVPWVR